MVAAFAELAIKSRVPDNIKRLKFDFFMGGSLSLLCFSLYHILKPFEIFIVLFFLFI